MKTRKYLVNDGNRDYRVRGIEALTDLIGYDPVEALGCDAGEFDYAVVRGSVEIGEFEIKLAA